MDETLIIYGLPQGHTAAVEAEVNRAGVILSNSDSRDGCYRVADYMVSPVNVYAFLDRNVLSSGLRVFRERTICEPVNGASILKAAAACWAFLSTIRASFGPSLALYELTSTQGTEAAKNEYVEFMNAVSCDPVIYSSYVVGCECEPREPKERIAATVEKAINWAEFEKPIKDQRASYLALLKIAEILREDNGSGVEQFERYVRWMESDSLFNAFGVVVGVLGFCDNPPGGVISGFRKADPSSARAKIERASWDLAQVRNWYRECLQASTTDIVMLCTVDRGLKAIANAAVYFEGKTLPLSEYKDLFESFWGREAQRIGDIVQRAERAIDVPGRKVLAQRRVGEMEGQIVAIERRLGLVSDT